MGRLHSLMDNYNDKADVNRIMIASRQYYNDNMDVNIDKVGNVIRREQLAIRREQLAILAVAMCKWGF